MRIEVVRSGGFAGISRRAHVDTAGHPDAACLESLAHSALSSPSASTAPQLPGVPDGYAYTLTVDDRTIHCADPHLSSPQRELIRAVLHEGA
jgi:hypothetical protein